MNDRIKWIDLLRGFCMLLVIWLHTEIYYSGKIITPYSSCGPNILTIFFFISGFLFFNQKPFSLKSRLMSIARNIVLPYFFFTLLLAVPKALMNHVPVMDVILQILKGNGAWFVTALTTAEVIFSCVLFVRNKWLLHCLPVAAFAAAWLLTGTDVSLHYNYWNFHNALIGLVFMYFGYEYHRHEKLFQLFNRLSSLFLLLIVLILIKIYVLRNGISLLMEPVGISNYPVFLVDSVCFILLSVGISQRVPAWQWPSWVGSHSLVYYFFCGAVPMLVVKLFSLIHFPYHSYWQIPIAFALICVLTTFIVWICYRYLPFLKHRR